MTDTPIVLRTFRIGELQISETDKPGIVELTVPDGSCDLTKEQWDALHQISSSYRQYGSDYVRFVPEPKQEELELHPGVPCSELEGLMP